MTITNKRLVDPSNLYPKDEVAALSDKISDTMAKLFQKPVNGGNPFLFSIAMNKQHEIVAPSELEKFRTAATDGKKYYWNPIFLKTLTLAEVATVVLHESYHVIFTHTSRMRGANPTWANIAMDLVVNSYIEKEAEDAGRKSPWGGNFGTAISLQNILDWIDGDDSAMPKPSKDKSSYCGNVYSDPAVYDRSPESVYDEIMQHWSNSPRKCGTCKSLTLDPKTKESKIPKPWEEPCCPECGSPQSGSGAGSMGSSRSVSGNSGEGEGEGEENKNGNGNGNNRDEYDAMGIPKPMDSHVDSKVSKQEVATEVMKAVEQSSQFRGSVPQHLEDIVGQLVKPQIKFQDIIRNACMRKSNEAGRNKDWSRFRKRFISRQPRMWMPKTYNHSAKWLCMLDTSGSMSSEDITYGLSQLQVLDKGGIEGYIVPCDSSVKWDSAQRISMVSDIRSTKVVGRGGTDFDEFFRDFPKKLGRDWDCVVVITDGYVSVDPKLRPRCQVVWIVTSNNTDFSPPFGRVVPLRQKTR
jgi:predicted metal-dependent peptidase